MDQRFNDQNAVARASGEPQLIDLTPQQVREEAAAALKHAAALSRTGTDSIKALNQALAPPLPGPVADLAWRTWSEKFGTWPRPDSAASQQIREEAAAALERAGFLARAGTEGAEALEQALGPPLIAHVADLARQTWLAKFGDGPSDKGLTLEEFRAESRKQLLAAIRRAADALRQNDDPARQALIAMSLAASDLCNDPNDPDWRSNLFSKCSKEELEWATGVAEQLIEQDRRYKERIRQAARRVAAATLDFAAEMVEAGDVADQALIKATGAFGALRMCSGETPTELAERTWSAEFGTGPSSNGLTLQEFRVESQRQSLAAMRSAARKLRAVS